MSAIVVIGAGPAGLATALELTRHGVGPLVLDRNERVGGIARTIWYQGCGFDIGPHRFYTKNPEVARLWQELLGKDLREVSRLTRIYYRGRLFPYPLKPLETFIGLGPLTTLRALGSYGLERLRLHDRVPANFEEWIVRRFGRTLFTIFFRTYTEKVWGIPCQQLGREWAAQRIQGLDVMQVVREALRLNGRNGTVVRSLVDRFHYPRLGAGQLYDVMADRIRTGGGDIRLGTPVTRLFTVGNRVTGLGYGAEGSRRLATSQVFASAPITALVRALVPEAPEPVLRAARSLRYRAHVTVNLIVRGQDLFPDQWVYIHSPDVKMARVANYGNFSPEMIREPGISALSVEYFCFEGDALWEMADRDLVRLSVRELEAVGLARADNVLEGFVVREPDAYPMYYLGHQEPFRILLDYLRRYENLCLIGRAGMYRYNNQDHAILTGLYAARNFLRLSAVDLFAINTEEAFLEEIAAPFLVEQTGPERAYEMSTLARRPFTDS